MMKYDFKLEIESENNSLSKIISRIRKGTKILEFGCANGRLTKYLKEEMNCAVTIVEIDEAAGNEAKVYAEKALLGEQLGDIEKYLWMNELDKETYDHIIFADVLEHLKSPETVLNNVKEFLCPEGTILVSFPNIANNAIVANLINDEFPYTDIGLLDRTHISFFTNKSFERLINSLDMFLYYASATYLNIGNSEIKVDDKILTSDLQKVLMKRTNGDIYQNIFEFGKTDKGKPIIDYNPNMYPYFSASLYFRYADEENLDIQNVFQQQHNSQHTLILEKEFEKPVNLIRFDPMESNGIVKINHIVVNGKQIDLMRCVNNAIDIYNNYLYFDNGDPYIYIEIEEERHINLEIDYSIEDFDMDKSIYKHDLSEYLTNQKKKIDVQNGKIAKIENIVVEKEDIIEEQRILLQIRNDEIAKYNNQILSQNIMLENNQKQLLYYAQVCAENEEQIRQLNEKVVISMGRLDSIKKRSFVFWRWLDKYNPLRYSREIDYFVDSVNVTFNKMTIKGWVISTKHESVKIKSRSTVSIKRSPRIDVNRVKGLSDDYVSGFEIKAVPFLPLHLKFMVGKEKNEYKVNGTKLYIKYFCDVYKKIKKSLAKRGLRRTVMLSWYMMIGKKHLYADSYDQWFALHKATPEELENQRNTRFHYTPLISIVVPTYNTPVRFLEDLLCSIESQTYSNWELCIADGHSTNRKTLQYLHNIEKENPRIHVKFLEENYMISGNTNEALKLVNGEFVCLMDHDDIIEPNALFEFVKMLNENPKLDFIYSDEDKVSDNGRHYMIPHFKPDFSIDNLRSFNYITHFVCIRKSLLDKVGPFDSKCDGAQDYDMFLRIVDETKNIGHVSKILYHWRVAKKSTARDTSNKSYVTDAGKYALRKHLERNNIKGIIRDGLEPTLYKIDYEIIGNPKISIIIATKDHVDDLDKCIKSVINKTRYKNYEIIVVENNSEEKRTFEYYKTLEKYENIKVVYWEHEFNYSAINNFGVEFATGEYILLLNNDIEVINEEWLEEMLMFAQRRDVGAVGAKLFYPDGTIQHAGVIIGLGGVAAHSHRLYPGDNVGYVGRLIIAQDLSAVTAACLLIKKSIFEEVGGLTVKYRVAFNDVDFCLKVREKGYLNVMTPFAKLYHYESKSRGLEDTYEKQQRFLGEQLMFKEDWHEILENGDPFYNTNLTLSAEDFSLKQL